MTTKALAAAESAIAKQMAEPHGTALTRNLRKRVKQRGLSIRAIAAGAGVDHSDLSRLLNNQKKRVSLDLITRLAAYFGCTVSELLDEKPSLAAEPVEGAGVVITLGQIEPPSFNARKLFDETALAELAESIAVHGLLQDLIVRSLGGAGRYELVAGERRWRALRALAKDGRWTATRPVPCRVVSGDDASMRAVALVENLQREDLAPLEEAEAYAALCKLDPKTWTTATIAERIGKTRRHVQLRLELLARLAPPLRQALAENRITLAQARAVSIADPIRQKVLLPDMIGERYLATAEDVRRAATRDFFPLELAIFDLEGLESSIAEDTETGARYFTDHKQFLERQKQAGKAKVAELKKKWAWAELRDYYSEWEFGHSTDKAKAGAVVSLNPNTGKVAVHTGLVKRARKSAAAKDKPPAPRPEVTKAHLIRAHNVKTSALQTAIAGNHRTSLILVILGLMGATRCVHISGEVHGGDDLILAPEVEAILDRHRPRFKKLLTAKGDDHAPAGLEIVRGNFGIGTEDKDEVALYQALKHMADRDLNELFAALVAARAGTFNEWGPELGDRRLAVALADDLGIDMAGHWQIDEAYLKLCRKARLAEIAVAIKVALKKRRVPGSHFPDATELEKMSGPKLREAIIARLEELRAAGEAPYIPREMRFGSRSALEARKPKPRPGQPGAGAGAGADNDLAASIPPHMRAKKTDG